jgi:diphthamide biosynthesis protein 7
VEVLHGDNGEADAVALCTYQLDAATGGKTGGVTLLRVEEPPPSSGAAPPPRPAWRVLQQLQGAAVFDCRWRPAGAGDTPPFLASALAGGGAQVHALAEGRSSLALVAAAAVADAGTSLLSVDWLPGAGPRAVVSRSDGCLSLCELAGDGALVTTRTFPAHALAGVPIEVWMAAADPHCGHTVWSGGDDGALRGWDLRAPCGAPTFACTAEHGAGVCSIRWHPRRPHLVATGSYDEALRLWDDRAVRRGPLGALECGGGVWRLKWHPSPAFDSLLLAACMHAGFRVVDVGDGAVAAEGAEPPLAADSMRCVEHFTAPHASLAYGADWLRPAAGVGGASDDDVVGRVASCSFYDHLLTLWQPGLLAGRLGA